MSWKGSLGRQIVPSLSGRTVQQGQIALQDEHCSGGGLTGYVTLSADGLGVGSGMYMMSPGQLQSFRNAVAGRENRCGSDLDRGGNQGERLRLRGERFAQNRAQGLSEGPPSYRLVERQGDHGLAIVAARGLAGDEQGQRRASLTVLRAAVPLNEWLTDHVGATSMAHARG